MTTLIPIIFGYIPLLVLVGLGIWLLFLLFKNISSSISAPPITRDAKIIAKRQVTNQGITYTFATFEFDDGSRQELAVVNGDYGILQKGDRGTVRYKGRFYKGFNRIANNSPAPQYSHAGNRTSSYNTQSNYRDRQSSDKLQLGLQRLSKAGNDRDLLGLALISLHGALEDYFRSWLGSNSSIPSSKREIVSDPRQMQWKGLIDLMQQYGGLNDDRRQYIFQMNRLRQDVGHGNPFTGTRSQLEEYADFVRGFVANGSSSACAGEYGSSSQQKGNDLSIDLRLLPHEAISGTEKQIKFSHLEQCQTCEGKGLNRSRNRCFDCSGTGRIQKEQKLKVTIPAGVDKGTRLRIAGEGDIGTQNNIPGDLYLCLYIEDD